MSDLDQQPIPSPAVAQRYREFDLLRIVLSVIIAIGIACAIYQYFYNRSLWLDEASLALNILDRSFAELLKPLDHLQVAPIGFLMIEKLMVVLLGEHEFSLRLFPLLCFLTSIPLLYRAVKNLTKDIDRALMATAVFSVTLSLISYASEVKQYAVDVLCTVLFLSLASAQNPKITSRILLLSFAGCVMIWFSNTSVILLFVLGMYFFWTEVLRQRRYAFLIPPICWVILFGVYYVFFIHNHPTRESMLNYWNDDFMPFTIFSRSFYDFMVKSTINVFGHLFGFRQFWLIAVLIVTTGVLLAFFKKQYKLLYLCIAPVLVHLILSGFHLYPFTGRLILYLLPFVIILYITACNNGFYVLKEYLPKLPRILLLVSVVVICYPLTYKFPVEKEEIKKSLTVIESQIQQGEHVYVYNSAIKPLRFYQNIGYTQLRDQLILGSRNREDYRLHEVELQQLKGKTWLLFSHIHQGNTGDSEETYMVNFLTKNGAQILAEWKNKGSTVYYLETGK